MLTIRTFDTTVITMYKITRRHDTDYHNRNFNCRENFLCGLLRWFVTVFPLCYVQGTMLCDYKSIWDYCFMKYGRFVHCLFIRIILECIKYGYQHWTREYLTACYLSPHFRIRSGACRNLTRIQTLWMGKYWSILDTLKNADAFRWSQVWKDRTNSMVWSRQLTLSWATPVQWTSYVPYTN